MRNVIAYHEAGHAVAGWFLEHAYPLVKVTIVPRGDAALGYAQYLPKEKYLTIKEEILDRMCMALGGRAVEELMFNKISTGALSDLQSVTKMAYAMVSVYGMNDKIGNISFYDPNNENSFSKPYSEETGKMIDDEVRILVDTSYKRVKQLLQDKFDAVKIIAEELLKKEVLFKDDLEVLIGKRPFQEENEAPKEETATAQASVSPSLAAEETISTTTEA
jgi:cell division protease FtsH